MMKFAFRLWVSLLCALPLQLAFAAEWTVYRFEGRDYLSLEDIAAFYGLPKPPVPAVASAPAAGGAQPSSEGSAVRGITPPLHHSSDAEPVSEGAAGAPAAPVAAGGTQGTDATPAAPATDGIPATPVVATEVGPTLDGNPDPASKTIALNAETMQLEVTPGLREVRINGVKQWLAFPVRVQGARVLVSRLDVSKIIEPRLRPERIPGLQPVTTVVLDPGHGGHDHGAVSRYGFEKDFALDVALRARQLLEKQGYKVVMTRSTDVFIPLEQRPAVANHIQNSIFVSLHFNSASSNADARGFEIFSMAPRGAPATNDPGPSDRNLREEPGNAMELPSSALAGSVFHALLGHVPMEDRGLKHARFAVLRLSSVPAVLVECGFVSNNAESTLISSAVWRSQVAEAITDGVENYRLLAETKHRPKVIADYRRAAASNGVQLR